jgi:hypothetical protein
LPSNDGGGIFIDPLPSNGRGYTYRQTDFWEGDMKYSLQIRSYAMIYVPNILKTGSGIQKFIVGYTCTNRKETA